MSLSPKRRAQLRKMGADGELFTGTDYTERVAYEEGAVARTRQANPSALEVLSAFGPTAALAVGTGLRGAPSPRAAAIDFVVYTGGESGAARESRTPFMEFLERGRELKEVGTVGSRFERLKGIFGDPIEARAMWDDGRSQVLWLVEFDDGTWATIFDYEAGTAPQYVKNWRVAGMDKTALRNVEAAIARGPSRAANPRAKKKQRLLR